MSGPAMPETDKRVESALDWFRSHGTRSNVEGLARYGIQTSRAFGVSVGTTKAYARKLGTDHALAGALWDTGWYEARLLAAFVDDPALVTAGQMNAWAADFDNWAVCDTVCFHLFDRTRHAWDKVRQWSTARPEFVKRASFAILWGLTVHDKAANDDAFRACLPLIEQAADDDRRYVKKAVDMALRAIGKRNAALNGAATLVARRLAESDEASARWVGKHAEKELASPSVQRRLKA